MEVPVRKAESQRGLVLALTIILILGVSAISVGTMYSSKIGRMSSSNYANKTKAFLASDGLMTLLAQEIINGNGANYIDATRFGQIDGEVWINIAGTSVTAFRQLTITRPNPDRRVTSNHLGNNVDFDNYGAKWTGYLIPPLTGNYTFYTRSDDESLFYLSSDNTKANLDPNPKCWLYGWVTAWPTSGTAVSKPIPLIGGRRYYFEYYHKEGTGVDIGQMGWDGPEYFAERPISGKYLSRFASDPAWAGTVNVGAVPVRYQVQGAGQDRFRLSTESIITKPKAPNDTAFRTPLNQLLSLKGSPVKPPDQLWLRVIHYDYPSDGRANEFNQPVTLGVFPNMVNATLTDYVTTDAGYFGRTRIPKPTRNQITPNRNCGLNKWFKDWAMDTNRPIYASPGSCATAFHAAGTNWQNRKFYDSLQFTLDVSQGPSTYVYSRLGNVNTGDPTTSFRGDVSEYFPPLLEAQGQDPAGSGHNYGFCTELHTTFVHQSGLRFEFTGDDDVWVFVNGRRVIDLGGVHSAASAFLQLDDLTDLVYGQTYEFDFFQCERQRVNSASRIVTNIMMTPPLGKPVAQWRRDYANSD